MSLLVNDIENANIEKVKCYYHEFKKWIPIK